MFESVNLKKLKPYKLVTPKAWEALEDGEKNILKLDWNEATIPPTPKVNEALIDHIHNGYLHWYPSTNNLHLISELENYTGLQQKNFTYFGSSDVAHECILKSFCSQGDKLLINAPTYDNFRVVAEALGAHTEFFYPTNFFSTDLEGLSKKINELSPKIVYICNPNNPTGVTYEPDEIETLIKNYPYSLFIIDEAYFEFTGKTCANLAKTHSNIIVTRTFSKAFALASFRIGYAIASHGIVDIMSKIRNPKNISALSQVAAIAALKDADYTHQYVNEVNTTKEWLQTELQNRDFKSYGDGGNFLIIETDQSKQIIEHLMKQNIYVRDLSHLQMLDRHFRITVGTRSQMELFLKKIDSL